MTLVQVQKITGCGQLRNLVFIAIFSQLIQNFLLQAQIVHTEWHDYLVLSELENNVFKALM